MNRPAAILLDFYGTVVKEDDVPIASICAQIAETAAVPASPNEIGEFWGREFTRLCRESYGAAFRTQKELESLSLQRVLERFRAPLDPRKLSEILYAYWRQPATCSEAKAVLEQCDIPVGLVSNIDNAELDHALQYNNLHFDFVVTSEDCRAYKPRPELFNTALAKLGLNAKSVLFVGDSLGCDVRGAKAVDIPVLWINRRGRPTPIGDDAPEYTANDLTMLITILKGEIEPCMNKTSN